MDPRGTSPSRAGHEHTHTQPYPSRPRKSRHQVSSFISQASSRTPPENRVHPHTYTTTPHTSSSSSALFPPLSLSSALHQQKKSKNKGLWKTRWTGSGINSLCEGRQGQRWGGAWEEKEEPRPSLLCSSSVKRAGSKRSAAASSFTMPPCYHNMEGLISLCPSRRHPLSFCYTEEEPLAWMSYESVPPESFKEEPGTWASPELRESMEGARA